MAAAENTSTVTRYVLDNSASSFTVRVFPDGFFAAFGHSPTLAIRDFSGDADFSPDALDSASLTLKIRADSLQVTDDIKSSDRREIESTAKNDVLETAKYPEITFESTAVTLRQAGEGRYQADIRGNLSLHGVTQNVPASAQVTVSGDRLTAEGEFSLAQSRFDIKPVRIAGGALKLKDEMKFRFNIVARAQK